MSIRFSVTLAIALALPAPAQQKTTQVTTVSDSKPALLTVEGVVAMVSAELSDDVIIARLRKENKGFDLSPDDMIRLKKSKVSDAVMRVMLDPRAEINAARSETTANPQVVAAAPRIPVLPVIGAANPSGATPAPGAEAKGDPNDPLAPHDSGIYLMTKDRDGKPQMIVLERASYQGSKSGGYLASAMTYGIKKAKTKAVIPGARANIRVAEASPVFYFYFDDKQAGLGKTYFGVGNLSNPGQFSLIRLEVNKENRESTVGEFSALGSSSGTDAKSMIPFKSERVRPGLYKVDVENLKSGEYCFVASSNMGIQSPYGMTANMTSDIFDFGANVE